MSMEEAAAQLAGKFNVDHSDCGKVGYLREPYFGAPYPTQALVPEAFRDGQARIAASDLQKRLPDALSLVETREQCFGFSRENQATAKRMQNQFRDFVALCVRKENETGLPCLIVASR